MQTVEREPTTQGMLPKTQGMSAALPDAASFAAQLKVAWAAGTVGWDRLAAAWGVAAEVAPPVEPAPVAPRCWWDDPPWHGRIADAEFRTIVALYVARYGAYTPGLPAREPEILCEWLRGTGRAMASRAAA